MVSAAIFPIRQISAQSSARKIVVSPRPGLSRDNSATFFQKNAGEPERVSILWNLLGNAFHR